MLTRSLLSLGVAGALCAAMALPAAALDRRVKIVNQTGYTIVEFYASNTGTSDWQEDILGPDVLPSGSSVMVNIDDGTGYCKYDLLAVFEDGDEVVRSDLNVCEVGTFTYN
ncbi:hypothetical protein GVY41_08645 [Frigidibacter albus]|uniref:Argininosuccinate lyase n=1 Tax=Frigidibacter albus TaxID=1465486 RepID=A0A6L8VEX8_9RHOB|nr:hypothetical protein [Frigidibacter albus]MZQ88875.1 hypothetical protein [Frigidibacter albus]NBE31068.1 hypothetical protein [Frigidibacter albus]GGH52666.1 hypothetical protein GCM10011341_17410 [Frigidibacter albus]